jgi:hypothetical protein
MSSNPTNPGPITLDQYHRIQDRAVTAVVGAVCGLGFAGAVVPVIEHAITVALLTLAVVGVLVAAARWGARVVWERREDRADARAAVAWRAAHLSPDHPLVRRDRLDGVRAQVRAGAGVS